MIGRSKTHLRRERGRRAGLYARPSLEALERRVTLSGDSSPAVIFKVDAFYRETSWIWGDLAQPDKRWTQIVGSLPITDRFVLAQTVGSGNLQGEVNLSVIGSDTHLQIDHRMFEQYQHFGGWPLFISWMNSDIDVTAYVLGDPGTSYQIEVSTSYNKSDGNWGSDGFVTTSYAQSSTSTADTIEYQGHKYSAARTGAASHWYTHSADTGPNKPPYVQTGWVNANINIAVKNLTPPLAKPDLVATAFQYVVLVPNGATQQPNGPVPTNLPYTLTASVKNIGIFKSDKTKLSVYASWDPVINSNDDFLIASYNLPPIAPGSEATFTIQMQPPDTWPPTLPPWYGQRAIGMIIDPDHQTNDSDFRNNQNQGVGIDRQPVQLYDPVPPETVALSGATLWQARLWLFRNGFTPVVPNIGGGFPFGSGWFKPLSPNHRIRSPFDGRVRNGLFYRVNAFVQFDAFNTYKILVQGNEMFGEPSPQGALFGGVAWTSYVYDWHARF